MITIRAAGDEDVDSILDVIESVAEEGRWIGTELPIDRAQRAAKEKERYIGRAAGCMFVAEVDGKIVGCASVSNDRGLVDLGMAIISSHRRRGIGTMLLTHCVDWSREQEARKITLQVWPHNAPALALYERFGFDREGYLKQHYLRNNGEAWDCFVMGLILSD